MQLKSSPFVEPAWRRKLSVILGALRSVQTLSGQVGTHFFTFLYVAAKKMCLQCV